MSKTVYYRESLIDSAQLVLFNKSGFIGTYSLGMFNTLGRVSSSARNDIAIDSPVVSRRHGEFILKSGKYYYRDAGSTNGTYINDRLISSDTVNETALSNGDVLRFGVFDSGELHPECVFGFFSTVSIQMKDWGSIALSDDIAEICIGRSSDSGMQIKNDMISERHASFFLSSRGWAIIDHNSTNGVFLNGERLLAPVHLKPLDIIRIVNNYFVFLGDCILYSNNLLDPRFESRRSVIIPDKMDAASGWFSPELDSVPYIPASYDITTPAFGAFELSEPGWHEAAPAPSRFGRIVPRSEPEPAPPPAPEFEPLDEPGWHEASPPPVTPIPGGYTPPYYHTRGASSGDQLVINIVERSVMQRFKKLMLLQDINISVSNGDMVLILGGSGAGKTTFINAVMGYEKARGRIVYNDTDIYEEYEQMKFEIGFVPQQDLLRGSDTVYDTLSNAAEMKLPLSCTAEAREARINLVLDELGLSRESESLVSKLSGGQKKRLSIAVELIADPSLFFLDEPDSGIDDIMGRGIMENLRHIADSGKIVMVITHSPERAADLFDKVIVLAKSTLDNCGHLAFYGTVDEAYEFFDASAFKEIVKKINRPDENGEGLSDHYIEKYKSYRGGR